MLGSMTEMNESRSEGLSVVALVVALVAVVGAVLGVGLGFRAIDEAEAAPGGGAGAGGTVEIALSEFAIAPTTIEVAEGGTLTVVNDGSAQHDLTVVDTDVKTELLNGGESTTLDLSSLAAGTYEVICSVPGHADSGMRGTLVVGGASGGSDGHASGGDHAVDWEAMDEMMHERTASFPAATEGTGATDLAPTVAPDGAKVFELTASEFEWEVEPGKVVQAMGYNGMVPGPTLRVEVGDTVRIVLHNEMEQSTALHSHGFVLPNAMDGVPDITQEPIQPGDSFTYEFVATHAMVGMYHSHHNAHIQVPNGMLGAFYVGDMPLPAGTPTPAQDIPMVLNDAGSIGLSLNGKSFPATAPIVAKVGDWIKLDYMNEGMQVHPMHLHGMPQLVIAKDGYPLATPSMEDTVTVAPGERVSVLVHVTEPGVWAWHCHILNHAEGDQGMFGMVTALIAEA